MNRCGYHRIALCGECAWRAAKGQWPLLCAHLAVRVVPNPITPLLPSTQAADIRLLFWRRYAH